MSNRAAVVALFVLWAWTIPAHAQEEVPPAPAGTGLAVLSDAQRSELTPEALRVLGQVQVEHGGSGGSYSRGVIRICAGCATTPLALHENIHAVADFLPTPGRYLAPPGFGAALTPGARAYWGGRYLAALSDPAHAELRHLYERIGVPTSEIYATMGERGASGIPYRYRSFYVPLFTAEALEQPFVSPVPVRP